MTENPEELDNAEMATHRKMDVNASEEQKMPDSINKQTDRQILEKMIGMARYYQYVSHYSPDLIFDPVKANYYQENLTDILMVPSDNVEPFAGLEEIRNEYNEKHIENTAKNIITTAEEIAEEMNIKKSFDKRVTSIGWIFVGIFILGFIGLAFAIGSNQNATWIILLLPVGFIAVPALVRMIMLPKWKLMKSTINEELKARRASELATLKEFITFILIRARTRLIELEFPIFGTNIILFDENESMLRTVQVVPGKSNNPTRYLMEFIAPDNYDQIIAAKPKKEPQGPDIFYILINPEFKESGNLEKFAMIKADPNRMKLINMLLNSCEFTSVDKPEIILPGMKDFSDFITDDDELIIPEKMKHANAPLLDHFGFFLVIGKPLNDGSSPFIIFPDPDHINIPSGLNNVFKM